jgi:hypothetical protein
MALLQDLEGVLKKAGFSASIKPSGGAQSPNVLAVDLEPDAQGRQRGLLLTLVSSVMESMQMTGEFDEDTGLDMGGVDFLQYYVALPFKVDSACFPATAQLIGHINKSAPLMGFNLDALTRTVYFRTMMIFEGEDLNAMLVIEIVRTIVFLLSEFGAPLEAVSDGRQSLDEAIKGMS